MNKEKLKTVNIKGKEYVAVAERVRYFNEAYPKGRIDTEIISHDNGIILIRAVITPDIEQPMRFFVGYAQEEKGKGMVNATSYVENCQTSAIGRALGIMGIGIENEIASADEVRQVAESISLEDEIAMDDQIIALKNKIADVGIEEARVLKYLKVDNLENISIKQYKLAMTALDTFQSKKK